ncbi:MAG: hypothetical protein DRR42_09070 [Gammaproteobacteria bacterium]|nr:MAG: hypothetical protein DRR42_09070 [Gammaproteobacteria bacterium]
MTDMQKVRNRTESLLFSEGVPLHPNLPVIENVSLRAGEDVAKKIVALYAMAGLANGADGESLREWLMEENGWNYLSTEDKLKLESVSLSQTDLNELSWKQESLYALSWSGSLIGKMIWPDSEANLESVFDLIPPEKPIKSFVRNFVLRPERELVEELDLYYCLHAAAVHPELWGRKDMKLKMEVILERRQALEWLCSMSIEWKDIPLDT